LPKLIISISGIIGIYPISSFPHFLISVIIYFFSLSPLLIPFCFVPLPKNNKHLNKTRFYQ